MPTFKEYIIIVVLAVIAAGAAATYLQARFGLPFAPVGGLALGFFFVLFWGIYLIVFS